MEPSKVRLEVRVLAHACVYTMVPSDSPALVSAKPISFVLDGAHFLHRRLIEVIDVVEVLVGHRKMASVGHFVAPHALFRGPC